MYLHKSKRKDGRVYLALVEGYRQDGKSKMRTVESLGYLDKLQELYDDPIAHFQAVCDERNAAKEAEAVSVKAKLNTVA